MSIENFEGKYPLNKELLDEIIKREKKAGMSPVASLARSFALEAGSGLRELLKGMSSDSDVGFALDPNSFVNVPTEIVNNIIRHHFAVFYGASIVELEQSMVEGSFDVVSWFSLYSMVTAGTGLPEMKVADGKSVETLGDEHLKKMRKFSSENKTYSGFFTNKEGFALLPKSVKSVFSQGNILSVVKSEIIPVFEPRAALLIAPTKVIVGG